jgi:alkylresorcinol/alkylpyrone synthase
VTSEAGVLAAPRRFGPLAAPVRLAGFGSASPPHCAGPDDLAAIIARVWPELARHVRPLLDQSAAVGRRLARPPNELLRALSPAAQSSSYRQLAASLAAEAAETALTGAGIRPHEVGLLVVASCTGFVLPGVDVALCSQLGLRDDVARLPLTLFGCGGGAAGLAHATDWVRGHPDQAALVVAVELPSLTFRPDDTSIDNLLSVLVFGDGAAALVTTVGDSGLLVGRSRSLLVPASSDALGYRLAAGGLQVLLSRRLPELLADALPVRVAAFLGDVPASDLDAVAVHPGGPGILEAVQRCLGLTRAQTAASWKTLGSTGNTSSAALLSVLGELSAAPPAVSGRGLGIGFGPGISIELLELFWRC